MCSKILFFKLNAPGKMANGTGSGSWLQRHPGSLLTFSAFLSAPRSPVSSCYGLTLRSLHSMGTFVLPASTITNSMSQPSALLFNSIGWTLNNCTTLDGSQHLSVTKFILFAKLLHFYTTFLRLSPHQETQVFSVAVKIRSWDLWRLLFPLYFRTGLCIAERMMGCADILNKLLLWGL